jgi:carboxymethylenebutenolidase
MKVNELKTTVPVHGTDVEAFVFRPEGTGRFPGILFLTDLMGIREANLGMAKRVAEQGYTVFVPNVFFHTSKLPIFTFKPNFGEERTLKLAGQIRGDLPPAKMVEDGNVYVDWVLKETGGSKLGVVGYCFTGQVALRIAAARPNEVVAAASFHGGGLYTDAPDGPQTVIPKVKARLYFGHAHEDRSMPAEAITKLEAALKSWGGKYESETYPAGHGWTVPDHEGVYDEKEAERHYTKLFDLFNGTLK